MLNGLGGDQWSTLPTHGSSNLHFMHVTTPDNDVVNEVPVFGPWMHPRSLVHVTELEESVCDGKTQIRAEREQPEASTIHVANTMMTNDSMPYVVISAYPGIEIAQQYDFVILQNSSEGGTQRVIKTIFQSSDESKVGEYTLTKVSKRFLASGSRNVMSHSSIAMEESWVLCKIAVLTANPTP